MTGVARETLIVEAAARIHIGLCDLGRATLRAYGGIGFAVETPGVRIRLATGSADLLLKDADTRTRSAALAVMRKLADSPGAQPFSVSVEQLPEQHSGLGAKTALLLAIIKGAAELFGLPFGTDAMQALSGRGGTSGIGVHTFFSGGVIWDGGHPQEEITDLLPSSARVSPTVPPCLGRWRFPEHWAVCLLTPAGHHFSGEREFDLFRRGTPVPRAETLETIAIVSHGVIPAFAQSNLPALAASLEVLSSVGFKAREIVAQTAAVRGLLSHLHKEGIAAGMSSLGPTVFCVINRSDQARAAAVESLARKHAAQVLWTRGQNTGARVSPE